MFDMFQYLAANGIIKLFIFKGQIFSVCIDKGLVGINFGLITSLGIIVYIFFHNDIGPEGGIVTGTNFNDFIFFLNL